MGIGLSGRLVALHAVGAETPMTVKLSDGGGLQLWVTPSGGKLWNLAYRFVGKQCKLAIGPYPAYSLKDARAKRGEARRAVDNGLDPSQQKRRAKAEKANSQANTFELVAAEFFAKKKAEGRAAANVAKMEWLIGIATSA
jgi:Arm DNA-binding domain